MNSVEQLELRSQENYQPDKSTESLAAGKMYFKSIEDKVPFYQMARKTLTAESKSNKITLGRNI
jgi:hypothetical protein